MGVTMLLTSAITAQAHDNKLDAGIQERAYTVQAINQIARPVLTALSEGSLKASMPVFQRDRGDYASLEAFGRTLAGIAPWLELGPDEMDEGKLRAELIGLTVKGVANAVNPDSPDYMNFNKGSQPLVDAAFFAQGLLRARRQLWDRLSDQDRTHVIAALKLTRVLKPGMNNWLLFSAMREAAIWEFTGECQEKDIEFAIQKHLEWYKGDGTYGDGPEFHWDYYNSFVIQPMLLDVVRICVSKKHPLGEHYELLLKRAVRYAAVQERMISPEGTYPVIGRSSAYRFGAFQTLSLIALMKQLPSAVKPGTARAALTAVIRRTMEAPGSFDDKGWLRPGAVGYQPTMADTYISTGSLYLCTVGMLHLGLPASDPCWTDPGQPWTQKRIWSGEDVGGDHALK